MHMAEPPADAQVLQLLRERNRAVAPACRLARSYQELLTRCAALQAACMRGQQHADLLSKEKHEMVADLELLRQNEANAGVSREHIELLQEQLERAKSQAASSARDAAAAAQRERTADESAHELATKASKLVEELELARDRIGVLERAAQTHKQDEASLRSENARLLGRLMDQMSMQAQAMDSEIRAHEERIAASAEASGTVPGADGSETSAAEAARGAGDSGAARRDAAPRDRLE